MGKWEWKCSVGMRMGGNGNGNDSMGVGREWEQENHSGAPLMGARVIFSRGGQIKGFGDISHPAGSVQRGSPGGGLL